MKLTEWLTATGKTQSELAEAIGARTNTISRYVTGRRTPSPRMIAKIKAATNGVVTADDLIADR